MIIFTPVFARATCFAGNYRPNGMLARLSIHTSHQNQTRNDPMLFQVFIDVDDNMINVGFIALRFALYESHSALFVRERLATVILAR